MQEMKETKYELRGALLAIYRVLTILLVFGTAILAWYINVRIGWRRKQISATLFLEGILYTLLYSFFSRLYDAHEIEGKRYSELLFSQMLSFGLSDICLYIAAFIWFHNSKDIFVSRFVAVYLVQVIISANLTLGFGKIYRKYTGPKNILVLYGTEQDSVRSSESGVSGERDKDRDAPGVPSDFEAAGEASQAAGEVSQAAGEAAQEAGEASQSAEPASQSAEETAQAAGEASQEAGPATQAEGEAYAFEPESGSTYRDFVKIIQSRLWRPYYQIHSVLPDTTPFKDLSDVANMCDELYLFDVRQDVADRLTVYGSISHKRMFLTPQATDILTMRGHVSTTFGIPLIESHGFETAWYYKPVKRGFDILCALVLLLALFPVFLFVGLRNRYQMGAAFLDRQVCLTYGGYVFHLYRFGGLEDNHSSFAAWVKRLRLDRLPEFLSVLGGGLSLVGPTPVEKSLAWNYIRSVPDYRIRHNAKAGITGAAQVWCGTSAPFYDRLRMDQLYCSQMSIYTDLRILFYSIKSWVDKVRKDQ